MKSNPLKKMSGIAMLAALALGVPVGARATIIPNGSFSGALISGTVTTTNTGGPGVNPGSGTYDIGPTTTQIKIANGVRHLTGDVSPYLGSPNDLRSPTGPVSIGDRFTVRVSTVRS